MEQISAANPTLSSVTQTASAWESLTVPKKTLTFWRHLRQNSVTFLSWLLGSGKFYTGPSPVDGPTTQIIDKMKRARVRPETETNKVQEPYEISLGENEHHQLAIGHGSSWQRMWL